LKSSGITFENAKIKIKIKLKGIFRMKSENGKFVGGFSED
jgi:hypothetical protein